MKTSFASKQAIQLRQQIIAQCKWSENYPSLKPILQRTGNQLPLVVTFAGNAKGSKSTNGNSQTIFFFARNVSTKLLFTPLQQRAEHFDPSPRHCTFVLTDSFKGEPTLSHPEVSIGCVFKDCSNSFSMVNALLASFRIWNSCSSSARNSSSRLCSFHAIEYWARFKTLSICSG